MSETQAALIIGAGPGLGGGLCRRFAREGYHVCGVRRRHSEELEALCKEIAAAGGQASGFEVDVRQEDAVVGLFDRIENGIGPLEVVIFNPGANINIPIREMSVRKFTKVWEMACFAGFLVGRGVGGGVPDDGHDLGVGGAFRLGSGAVSNPHRRPRVALAVTR